MLEVINKPRAQRICCARGFSFWGIDMEFIGHNKNRIYGFDTKDTTLGDNRK